MIEQNDTKKHHSHNHCSELGSKTSRKPKIVKSLNIQIGWQTTHEGILEISARSCFKLKLFVHARSPLKIVCRSCWPLSQSDQIVSLVHHRQSRTSEHCCDLQEIKETECCAIPAAQLLIHFSRFKVLQILLVAVSDWIERSVEHHAYLTAQKCVCQIDGFESGLL